MISSKIWLLGKKMFSIYLKIAIRLHEIFPRRYLGFGLFSYFIALDIVTVHEVLLYFHVFDDNSKDFVFCLAMLFGLINLFFLLYYFDDIRLVEFLGDENSKGYRYRCKWRLIVWIYLILSVFPLIYWFITENFL